MKLTRRQLVVAAATATYSGVALAQTSAASASDAEKQAGDDVQRNADALAKLSIPISTEPAFQFKA